MAARCLIAAGKTVRVLEVQNLVGGCTLNAHSPEGDVLELDGQWLEPTQARIYALCRELGLETHPQALARDRQTFAARSRSRSANPEAYAYFQIEMAGLFAAETTELSLLHIFYLESSGEFTYLAGVDVGAQGDRVAGNPQRVARKLAEALADRVLLASLVRWLEQDDKGVKVVTATQTPRATRVAVGSGRYASQKRDPFGGERRV